MLYVSWNRQREKFRLVFKPFTSKMASRMVSTTIELGIYLSSIFDIDNNQIYGVSVVLDWRKLGHPRYPGVTEYRVIK